LFKAVSHAYVRRTCTVSCWIILPFLYDFILRKLITCAVCYAFSAFIYLSHNHSQVFWKQKPPQWGHAHWKAAHSNSPVLESSILLLNSRLTALHS
jgi:hypothetical protein